MSDEHSSPYEVARKGQGTVSVSVEVLEGKRRRLSLAKLLPFLGPAFIASVAYVDPGNFATNIQAGAQYGYLLIWVIALSNIMAMLIQSLSAKLGIATGKNLPETIRDHAPKPVVWFMWIQAEVVAMATDLAEFLGAALGFYLLFGIDLFWGGILTGIFTFLILGLQRYGFRPLEAVITAFLAVIAACYVIELFLVKPDVGLIGQSLLRPRFSDTESVLLASGILGATVMPHVIYLHSSLTQNRIIPRNVQQAKRIYRFEIIDVVVAMGIAGFVNASMLVMAAETFFHTGRSDIASIEQAYETLTPLLGGAASTIFAISLLASGLSSSAVGTMTGQVIMQGFIRRKIPIWLRRLITMLPALVVIALGLDPTRTLVISQVILSFGIPFALVPLLIFTSKKSIMGNHLVNRKPTIFIACIVATLIISLNLFMLYETISGLLR